jgi:hypothetical protein
MAATGDLRPKPHFLKQEDGQFFQSLVGIAKRAVSVAENPGITWIKCPGLPLPEDLARG